MKKRLVIAIVLFAMLITACQPAATQTQAAATLKHLNIA
jgi:protein involved in sex pheromone biosynthesis